jgi:hypothetical protein
MALPRGSAYAAAMRPTLLLLAAAVLAAHPAAASFQRSAQAPARTAPAAEEWVNLVTIQRLRDEFADRPGEANLGAAHERGWTLFSRPVAFPEPHNRRAFVGESYVLLDLDDAGLAAGCRPLRPGAAPRLDAFACALLMRPGYFSATFVPQRESLAGRWVMGFRWESLPAAAQRAREARTPLPQISAPPPR